MTGRIRDFFRSLELRLLLPLSVTVGVVLAAHAFISFRSAQEHFLGFVRAQIERSSRLIMGATHDGMLLNRLEDVQTTITRLADAPEVVAIRVCDKQGTIVLSADPAERGEKTGLGTDTCGGCHGEGETRLHAVMERSSLRPIPEDPEILRYLHVIENEPACADGACHFHPADERVLGVLDVEMSMAPLNTALAEARRQLVGTTMLLILISGIVGAVFIRRVIQRPVRELERGTRRIAAGDLDACIDVRGQHELGRLAAAFNGMVADLRTARGQLTEWSHTLEHKVDEKTAELRDAERQVLHMEKMASLGKLSATVAHELNNPISGVLTYARLIQRQLAEQPIDAAVRAELDRYLGVVDKECSRCGTIVHNLLSFARQTGAQMAPVDVDEIVERSLMLVRHHFELSGVALRHDRLETDPVIVADAGQLQQALVALLVNAAESMSTAANAEAALTVRLRGEAEHVEIEVRDTGSGIAPDVLPHIFEPFFSTKGNESGVGLGLAVTYGIVNRHGGTIDVESQPGRGTTFRLRLPRRPPAVDEDAAAA